MPLFRSLETLQKSVKEWQAAGLRVGFTCGSFDLLHAGHLDYLEKAAQACDRLIVAVNSDASVRSYKNPLRPIVPEEHRLALVAGLRCVDAALLMEETRPAALLQALRPDLYIKGGDYAPERLKSASLVEAYGGRCLLIPVVHEISTTALMERIVTLGLHAAPMPAGEGTAQAAAKISGKNRLVLLDRDGTLIENVHFLNGPSRVRLRANVGEGLRMLQDHGYTLVVATNQAGLSLGYFDYDAFVATNSEMLRQLAPYGVTISKFYFCPHSLADQCLCRKPLPGLLLRALKDFHADPANCWMIGDSASDAEAAAAAGVASVTVGSAAAAADTDTAQGNAAVAETFLQAAELVLSGDRELARL